VYIFQGLEHDNAFQKKVYHRRTLKGGGKEATTKVMLQQKWRLVVGREQGKTETDVFDIL